MAKTKKIKENVSDPKQVAEMEQREKNKSDRKLNDLRNMLSTNEGINFFKHLMTDGKVFSTSMTGNSWTFFNEGARNLALKKFSEMVEAFRKEPETLGSLILAIIINQEEKDNG